MKIARKTLIYHSTILLAQLIPVGVLYQKYYINNVNNGQIKCIIDWNLKAEVELQLLLFHTQ